MSFSSARDLTSIKRVLAHAQEKRIGKCDSICTLPLWEEKIPRIGDLCYEWKVRILYVFRSLIVCNKHCVVCIKLK